MSGQMLTDFNMVSLTTDKVEKHVHASILMESNIALFGRRGSGKTAICKQQIKKCGHIEQYINLSVLERVDLGGYPDIMSAVRSEKFIEFILPGFYKTMMEGDAPVTVLFDELDKAQSDLWAPLLEFIQFRHINGIPLKNLKAVLMTGNLISEGGQRPSLPLLDRAEKYLITPDPGRWMNWAGQSGKIHPSITAFIHDNPGMLFGDVDPAGELYADPSPRGWHNASKSIQKGERLNLSTELLVDKVGGSVGKLAGMEFKNYFAHYQTLLPMVKDIFEGRDVMNEFSSLTPSKQLVVAMITCSRFANKLDTIKEETGSPLEKDGDIPQFVHDVGRFVDNIPTEHALIAIRSQVHVDRFAEHQLDEISHWSDKLDTIHTLLNGDDEDDEVDSSEDDSAAALVSGH